MFAQKNLFFRTVTILALLLLLANCQPIPPIVVGDISYRPNPDIPIGAEAAFSVEASGKNLSYEWSATAGSFKDPKDPARFIEKANTVAAVYKAPDKAQDVTVTVIITGDGGQQVTKNLHFKVVDTTPITEIPIPVLTLAFTPEPILTPTQTLTPTATPHIVAGMGELSSWTPNYCDDNCAGANGSSSINISLVPGRTNNAIEVLYNVRNAGYVVITKKIDPETLAGTKGLSFFYKGKGAPNTVEFKLMLRYPDDTDDTTYGVSWPRATDTDDVWTPKSVPYINFSCWWPEANCKKHGDRLDPKMVLRMDFAVSNKPGDTAGPGRVAFEDVLGILP